MNFLFAGGMRDQKGVVQLAKAVLSIHCDRRRDVPFFVFHGTGPLDRAVRSLAGGLDRVFFWPGPHSRKSFIKRLCWADCVVAPSLHESFGLVAIEAAAAGRRVIVGANTETADMIGSQCIAVDGNNPLDIKNAIVLAMEGVAPAPDPTSLKLLYGERAFVRRARALYMHALERHLNHHPERKAEVANS
jgi:glycosyltransferase involved in cell wall biosynthesis